MSVFRELVRVGNISDYSEPLKAAQLRNRAYISSGVMLVLWGAGTYKAHHFPNPVQACLYLLGTFVILSVLHSLLIQVRTRYRLASQSQLWTAWRVQQSTAALAFLCIAVIFLTWWVIHL